MYFKVYHTSMHHSICGISCCTNTEPRLSTGGILSLSMLKQSLYQTYQHCTSMELVQGPAPKLQTLDWTFPFVGVYPRREQKRPQMTNTIWTSQLKHNNQQEQTNCYMYMHPCMWLCSLLGCYSTDGHSSPCFHSSQKVDCFIGDARQVIFGLSNSPMNHHFMVHFKFLRLIVHLVQYM